MTTKMTTDEPSTRVIAKSRLLRPALLTLIAATALLAAGCGAVGQVSAKDGNASRGKTLFSGTGTCGSCHTLADAGTKGTIGPNLDDAFRYDKKQGFDLSTIRDVVRGQIAYATLHPSAGGPGMPSDLVNGQDARDVAVYVAACSGNDLPEVKQACTDALAVDAG